MFVLRDDWREKPIPVFVHDDTGFENVPVWEGERPDRIILLNPPGQIALLDCQGDEGHGPDKRMLVREPFYNSLVQVVGPSLRRYDRDQVLVGAWRSIPQQADTYGFGFWRELGVSETDDAAHQVMWVCMRVVDILRHDVRARAIGLRAEILEDDVYGCTMTGVLSTSRKGEVVEAMAELGLTMEQVLKQFITIWANLFRAQSELTLDLSETSHGNGGAVDAKLKVISTGRLANMGSPPTDTGPIAYMQYFEVNDLERWREDLAKDAHSQQHLSEAGVDWRRVTQEDFNEARRNRRVFVHAHAAAGHTFFTVRPGMSEWWHINGHHNLGGNQAARYPYAGSGCQSLLADVRDESGKIIAVWSTKDAHRQAELLLG